MAQTRLRFAVSSLAGTPALEASGDVDFQALRYLSSAIGEILSQGSQFTVIDLRNVETIDDGAVGIFTNACHSVGPDRKICVIARGKPEQMLRKVRLDSMMHVVANTRAAAELIKGEP